MTTHSWLLLRRSRPCAWPLGVSGIAGAEMPPPPSPQGGRTARDPAMRAGEAERGPHETSSREGPYWWPRRPDQAARISLGGVN
jgi:hypothetical protein